MDEYPFAMDAAIVAAFVVAYSVVSRPLIASALTGPIVFVVFGILVSPTFLGVVDVDFSNELLRLLAEITLAIVIFSDASRINGHHLWRDASAPGRMLAIGLPLSIGLGTLLAFLIFGLGWWEAALLAAILAPTDPALAQSSVTNKAVPERLRQAINVESGTNDGLMAPIVALFLAGTTAQEGLQPASHWIEVTARDVGFGLAVGLGIGFVCAFVIQRADRRQWIIPTFRQIGMLTVAILLFGVALAIEGNPFVAAFVGGLVVGNTTSSLHDRFFEFSEEEGQLFVLLVFLFFAGSVVAPRLDELTWQVLLYALLSLTVVRMIPITLSLLGIGFRPHSWIFLAWFGPRGLASIVYALPLLASQTIAESDTILLVVSWTVFFSVMLHGVSAEPAARWLASRADDRDVIPEEFETTPHRPRFRPQ